MNEYVTKFRGLPRSHLAYAEAILRRLMPNQIKFHGPYTSFETAQAHSRGYSDSAILEKVYDATLAALDQKNGYEQDGQFINEPYQPDSLFYIIHDYASIAKKPVRVLDIGGALGTSYFKFRPLIHTNISLRWDVVEQLHFAELGQQTLQREELSFYSSMDDKRLSDEYDLILINSALQYIASANDIINALMRKNADQILIWKSPISQSEKHRIFRQSVPAYIYEASYPLWVFSLDRLLEQFTPNYQMSDIEFSNVGWFLNGFHKPFTFCNITLRKADDSQG